MLLDLEPNLPLEQKYPSRCDSAPLSENLPRIQIPNITLTLTLASVHLMKWIIASNFTSIVVQYLTVCYILFILFEFKGGLILENTTEPETDEMKKLKELVH